MFQVCGFAICFVVGRIQNISCVFSLYCREGRISETLTVLSSCIKAGFHIGHIWRTRHLFEDKVFFKILRECSLNQLRLQYIFYKII